MRKLFALIALCLAVFNAQLYAVDYWACASADAGAANEWDTVSAACTGTKLTYASRASGAVFHANSFTVTLSQATSGDIGANGLVTISNDNSAGSTAGGGFTCATATGSTTITANVTAGSTATAALSISGSTGSGCGVGKNGTTVTVSAGSGGNGVTDSHSVIALTHYANINNSGAAGTFGWAFSGATGSNTINGTATGGTGVAYNSNNAGTTSITNCVGSDTANQSGCNGAGAGAITVTGNVISGKRGQGVQGTIVFTPAAAGCAMFMGASGYGGNSTPSVCTASGAGTYQQMPSDASIRTQSTVTNGTAYGSYTGTNTGGSNSGSAN